MIVKKYFIAIFVLAGLLFDLSSQKIIHSVRLIFFDVGQGDSALIFLPDGRKILVDGGPDDQVLIGLGKYLNFFDRKIDLLILSHEHDDHSLGLIQVIRRYRVARIISATSFCDSHACESLFVATKSHNIPSEVLMDYQKIIFGPNCNLELFPPSNPGDKNINNRSLALRLVCGGAKVFLAGDGEKDEELGLLSLGGDLSATVFKASHHGSDTSNSENFIKAINPQLIIISVGAGNSFKHPSLSVLARFSSLGIRFFRTDINGNISLNFLGTSYPQISIDKE
ncbi:MAG: MBL fold metallo-hydrolase [Candidatus Falkowbacteria bacterium]|nr:MBL fold metallo-hydrolase [Candidatus Falkowbacteria bacterium]